MSRTILLSTLKQGLQRIREKGGADPDTLYDLENGYVGLDGAVEQRPGTALAYTLPAGTLGMCAHDGDLVVFSTSPKATPAGVRCEVITHPFFPSQGITYIWYAAPFLGYPYVVAEFENGDIYHYWLQAANQWEASTAYREGQIIVPSTPNGLGYKAHRVLPKLPTWTPGMEVTVGTAIEPTAANGYYYEATATSEADGVGTPGGSPNPDGGTTDPPGTDGGSVTGGTVPLNPENPGFELGLTGWVEGEPYFPPISSTWAVITDAPNAHGGTNFLRWTGDSSTVDDTMPRGLPYICTTQVDSPGSDFLIVNVWARVKRPAAGLVGVTRARIGIEKCDSSGEAFSNTYAGAVGLYGSSLDSGWVQISTFTEKVPGTAFFRVVLEAQGPAGSIVEFDDLTWNGTEPTP